MCEGGHGPDPAERPLPSLAAVLHNWRTFDAPAGTKLRMVFSNNLIKLRTHQGCCGHYGEPGC